MSFRYHALYDLRKKSLYSPDVRSEIFEDKKDMFLMHGVFFREIDKQKVFL